MLPLTFDPDRFQVSMNVPWRSRCTSRSRPARSTVAGARVGVEVGTGVGVGVGVGVASSRSSAWACRSWMRRCRPPATTQGNRREHQDGSLHLRGPPVSPGSSKRLTYMAILRLVATIGRPAVQPRSGWAGVGEKGHERSALVKVTSRPEPRCTAVPRNPSGRCSPLGRQTRTRNASMAAGYAPLFA